MTVNPDIIDAMVSAGCTAEQIAAVIRADYEAEEERRAQKREKDRIRQRRHRERNEKSRIVTHLTRDECDAPSPSSPPHPPNNPTPAYTPRPPTGDYPPSASADCEQAVEAWNEVAVELGLPRVKALNADRRKRLKARLRECGGIEGWREAMDRIRGSPFLVGENDREWRADFDFVLQPKSFHRLREGSYDGSGRKPARTERSDREAIYRWYEMAESGAPG